jgi:hypothetical protein
MGCKICFAIVFSPFWVVKMGENESEISICVKAEKPFWGLLQSLPLEPLWANLVKNA